MFFQDLSSDSKINFLSISSNINIEDKLEEYFNKTDEGIAEF